MAIKLKQTLTSGVVVNYHNIQRYMFTKDSSNKVFVGSYTNKLDRQEGKKPVTVRVFDVPKDIFSLEAVYEYLKLNQFKGGLDNLPKDG